jgi:5-formyltetrahydrofolate cyclo-ligase
MGKITKDTIRKKFRKKRSLLSYVEIDEASAMVQEKIKNVIHSHPNCQKVFLYREFDNEIIVSRLIPYLHRNKIAAYVPILIKGTWKTALVEEDTKWSIDKSGITFPINPKQIFDDLTTAKFRKDDMAIIPGLAFSIRGERLGYGKGVYDRLLFKLNAIKIGVCFDFQISRKLPVEQHDIPMDIIFTDKTDFKFV